MKYGNLFLMIFLFLLPVVLYSQTVRASVESETAYLGQSILYTIQIKGEEKVERPRLSGFEYFQISEAGESTSMNTSIINGKTSRQVVSEYSWSLTPLREGNLEIPAVQVDVDGHTVSTRKGILKVKTPSALEGFELILSTDSETAFPLMPMRLTLKWLFSSQVSSPEFTLPFLNDPNLEVKNVPAPSSQNNDIYQFTINGEKVYAMQSSELYEGEQYASLVMYWDIYPKTPGTLTLEPVILSFKRASERDSWGNYRYENAAIPSNSLTLGIQPLPQEVADYPGGILVSKDVPDVTVSLDQKRVYPGDPVTVTCRINHLINTEFLDFKGFQNFRELERDFKVDAPSLITDSEENSITISQTIRALSENLTEFPSLPVVYYNQASERVETIYTKPVPLEVVPLNNTETNLLSYHDKGNAAEHSDNAGQGVGIHHNASIDFLEAEPELLFPLYFSLLIPPFFFLLVLTGELFFTKHSKSFTQKLIRRKKTSGMFEKKLKDLKKNPSLDALRKFHTFLMEWLNREYAGLIYDDLSINREVWDKYFKKANPENLESALNELNRICWSGEIPDNLEEKVFEITRTLSGKGKAAS